MRALLVFSLFGILSTLALLLLAGHGPWSGRVVWSLNANHGLNTGDVPVLGLWGAGSLCCLVLLWLK